jgi:hypothetical protein
LFIFDVGAAFGLEKREYGLPLTAVGQAALLLWLVVAGCRELERVASEQPWSRAFAWVLRVGLLALLLAGTYPLWSERRDLARDRPWTASSIALKCDAATRNCGGGRTAVFFHTLAEANPWWQVDLEASVPVGYIKILNREDCCGDRALPLRVEVSQDGLTWRRVAQRTKNFTEWEAQWPQVNARYVRLRVLRTSALHLEHVVLGAR